MKKIILLLSLFSVVGFADGRPAVDMSRIYAAKEQAEKDFKQSKPVREKALEALCQTEKGRLYKRELDKKANAGLNSRPECVQAPADLRATEAYQNEFLPVEKDAMYHGWKLFGLQKMTRYVRAQVGNSDIESMYSGLHSALYVDAGPNLDLRETRDLVYHELVDMIKLEDRMLGIEEARVEIPEYQ